MLPDWIFVTGIVALVAWVVFMATFRTDSWIKLCDMDARRKQHKREGRARIGGMLLRAFFGK